MSTAEKRSISPQEYLAIERVSEIRHEYYNGEMFAMSGATRAHNVIAGNICRRFLEQFDDRECEAYQSNMRVKVTATGLYTYPDVVVTCDGPQLEDDELDTLLNPRVLVEVLSKSTENYDRGTKFEWYRRLPSLHDYLLVAQSKVHVEHFQRRPDDRWLLQEFDSLDRTVVLETSNCVLQVRDIYAKVSFDR